MDETGASRERLGPQECQEVGEAVEDLVVGSNRQIWCIVFKKRPVHFFYQTAVQGCFVRESIVIIVFSFEHKIGRPIFELYGLQYISSPDLAGKKVTHLLSHLKLHGG